MTAVSSDFSRKAIERRSTRLTARSPMLTEVPDDDMQVDSEYEQVAESSSRGKKRKLREDKDSKVGPPTKKIRGKRGLLRQLVEMPLDLLFEVFGHLKPLDLLHLARTTKDLRAILMTRSSTSIWKHARSQFDDLPDCPDDLSEPQYAELLFGKACSYCHRNLANNIVIWTSRVRSCNRCLPQNFSPHIYPTSCPRQLLEYVQVITLFKSRRVLRERLVYPLDFSKRWEEEYNALKTASERIDWRTRKAEELKAIKEHARLCEKWAESMKQLQEKEKTALIDSRKVLIMERVKALGWGDELSKIGPHGQSLENESYIEKTCQKDITGRVLIQIDDFIHGFMGNVKAKRLRDERNAILSERLPILRKIYDTCVKTYPINSIIPSASDVYMDPVVQDLIIGPPLSATFTDENLATVGTLFPDIVPRWRKQTEEKLLDMITQGSSTRNPNESLLQLATTIFTCNLCSDDPLTYPRVLVHRCATKNFYYGVDDNDLLALRRFLDCSYWNSGSLISFEPQKIAILTKAMKLCGLDPETATKEDMENQNPIFECLACNDARKGRCTLSWLGVYVHLRQHPPVGWNDLEIELLGDEDATKVRDRMAETLSHKKTQRFYNGSACVQCKMVGDVVTLAQHVNVLHSKPEPTNQDIVPVLDYASFETEHWLWPPRPVAGIPNLTSI